MKFKRDLFVVFFATCIFYMCFVWSMDAYAVSFDSNIAPEELYQLYGELPVFNEMDESIYYVIKVSSGGGGRPTGFYPFVTRMCIEDKYEIFIKAEESIYGEFKETNVGGYYYDMYCFKLETILDLFGQKYSEDDMSKYYMTNHIMEIDIYMGIRVRGVYTCYTDLLEDGKGGITSESAKSNGESAMKNLYTSAREMQMAYYNVTGLIIDFDMWYDRYLEITPDNVIEANDWDIDISDISVSGGNVHIANDGKVYVKASDPNTPFTLTVRSRSFYKGMLMGTSTFKPYQTVLSIHDKFVVTDRERRAEAYIYLTNSGDDNNPNIMKMGQYGGFDTCTNLSLISYSQKISNYNTADATWRCLIPEEVVEFKVTAYLRSVSGLTDTTDVLKVYGDATPPVINLPENINTTFKKNTKLEIGANDSLSGMDKIVLYDSDDRILAIGIERLEYSFDKAGCNEYMIVAYDNVGNSICEYFDVNISSASKNDYIIVGTH